MTTLHKDILEIPVSVTVGSGSFTIPVDRYGLIQMNTAISMAVYYKHESSSNPPVFSGSGGNNSGQQKLVSGNSISTSSSTPSASSSATSFGVNNHAESRILINGIKVCIAKCGMGTATSAIGGDSAAMNSQALKGWSVSLFRIPKENLPIGLAEGE